jgi:hypothetical protein
MKYLTTNSQLKHAYNLVAAGYCELQTALNYARPTAYTASKMYGWRADIYHFDGFTLATGYGTPSHAIDLPYDLCKSIETQCQSIHGEERLVILQREINNFLKSKE